MKFTEQYANQLLDFGGYALPRWFVIKELNELSGGQFIGTRATKMWLENEVTAKESKRLFTMEHYLEDCRD